MALTGSTLSGGKWFFPELYYTFTVEISAGGDTIQFVMIDTETLTGGQNQQPGQMPNLFYPPGPAGGRKILQVRAPGRCLASSPSAKNFQPEPVQAAALSFSLCPPLRRPPSPSAEHHELAERSPDPEQLAAASRERGAVGVDQHDAV